MKRNLRVGGGNSSEKENCRKKSPQRGGEPSPLLFGTGEEKVD